ncbi:MAG: exo-alpha-sialidase [Draconibacterium sp.]|nr:exo-alpha-sialidase [Draconibacterium sp.]
MKIIFLFISLLIFVSCSAQQKFLQTELFPSQEEHAHGATIVELANGDMLAAWFQGHGERWADDVRIMGARLHKGETEWSKPFLMADVPDFPDINPVLFIDNRETLWLVWYTVIANQWETSLPRYRISNNYMQSDGPPEWEWQDVIIFKPGNKTERGIQPGDKFVKSVVEQMKSTRKRLQDSGASTKQLIRFDEFAADIILKAKGGNMVKRGKIYSANAAPKDTVLGYP